MGIVDFILLGVSLSMDAFAIAMCKGLCMRGGVNYRNATIIAGFFGFFQFLMPVLGWTLGVRFEKYITDIDHWIAFVLLCYLGGRMIWDACHERDKDPESCPADERLDIKELLLMAIATSIDALAVGITLAFLSVNIWYASTVIGFTTFIISFAGVAIGNKFGNRFQFGAKVFGGTVLILIGLKILLEHLGIIMW
ncbi:MAG: manganese efflux pump MntP family protein [Sphaerochaetaceae bacterium]